MRNHPVGRTGLFVSELCLGTMTFGGTGAIGSQIGDLQQSDAERLVGHAVAAILYIKRKLTAAHAESIRCGTLLAPDNLRRHDSV
jgi:hypothetical protein